ncbi:MAG TPA: hypothetical protein VFT00_10260 [Nocardioides sp.]|nr:hypothetical protein [Nocardioides sp.]
MQPDSEDDAWRSIVDNYGDRVELGPGDPAPSEDQGDAAATDEDSEDDWDEASFVPPPPPPLPQVAPDRLAAWLGLFGSPTVLLTALVLGVHLPAWLGYLLVAWFIGGFVYLVALMPQGPRDPGDDGARL